MIKTKIYIAGKISGKESIAAEEFQLAESYLILQGFEPINPMKLPHNHNKEWASYMKECLKSLMDCDEIYMLSGWENSIGATIEHHIAKALKMKFIYQNI
jgi:hypothetical protein